MKINKRAPLGTDTFNVLGGESPILIGICAGVGVLVAAVFVAALLAVKRRRSRSQTRNHSSLKQFLLPKDVKPVISMKTAAGPGGLKKSPSPVQSPENPEREWATRSLESSLGGSLTESQCQPSDQQHRPSINGGTIADVMMDDMSNSTMMDVSQEQVNDEDGNAKKGELNFSLRYVADKNALQVTIVSGTNLWGPGQQLLDPYVKLQLLPEKQHKVKTRVVRNTLHPVYDEEFTFYGINYNQLQSTTLHFVVVAFDRYSRDEIVGEVICPLHSVELDGQTENQASLSMPLQSRTLKFQNSQHRGELLVSLCHQPATNKVTAVVLKAKNLPKFDVTGMSDPYVKVYMLYNGQKVAKKKTHVKKRTLSPVYNESFVFDLPSSDPTAMENVSFEFLVMDWDRVTKNEVMGRMVIGCEAKSNSGKEHWEQVRLNPRRQFAEWHRLRP